MSEDTLSLNDRFTVNLGRLTISLPLWLWGAVAVCLCATVGLTVWSLGDRLSKPSVHFHESQGGYYDPRNGKVWMKSDNGSDVNWQGAKNFCAANKDWEWRLPTDGEVETLFRYKENFHLPGMPFEGSYLFQAPVTITTRPKANGSEVVFLWTSTPDSLIMSEQTFRGYHMEPYRDTWKGEGYGSMFTYNTIVQSAKNGGRVICVHDSVV